MMQTASDKNGLSVIDSVFDEMTGFEWLEASYRKARKQKRYRKEIMAFSDRLDDNLHEIQEELRDDTFVFGPYRRHWVYVPKKRLVMALPFKSRVVQWAIYREMNPFYDRMFIEDSYACREGKGTLAAVRRLQYWLRIVHGKGWYALKLDISKYFYRVDHAKLLEILHRRVKDEQLFKLLTQIVNANGERFGLPRFTSAEDLEWEDWLTDCGMPIGNLTSQMFANIYLNELDQFCKHTLHIRYYIRYMDDILVLAKTKEEANRLKEQIAQFLREVLLLDLNSKTSIQPAERVFLIGYEVTGCSLQLKKPTVRRMKRSFRAICSQYFSGKMTEIEYQRRVASYDGMMKPCEAESLRFRMNQIYLQAKERYENESTPEHDRKGLK